MKGLLVAGGICVFFWFYWSVTSPGVLLDIMLFRESEGRIGKIATLGFWVFFIVSIVTLTYLALLLNRT